MLTKTGMKKLDAKKGKISQHQPPSKFDDLIKEGSPD